MAALEIRPIRPEEYFGVGELTVAAYAALEGAPANHPDTEGYNAQLRDVAGRDKGAVVLVAADAGGRVVGNVTYVPDPSSPMAEDLRDGEAGIRMLAVDPAAWGQGAGRALTVACIDRARVEGQEAVFLHSTEWMTTAHRLYASLGFERQPDRDWEVVPGVLLLAFRLAL